MAGLRMDAYYYGFDKTGVPEIDRILSAVACAGKAFHHTNEWGDDASPYYGHVGTCPIDWIQNAANDAAKAWNARPAAAVDELIEAYRAVVYEEACLHCGKGEAWTVKCPDGTYLCETWGDSGGQANVEEMAEALNCAYKQGYAAARAALTGEE